MKLFRDGGRYSHGKEWLLACLISRRFSVQYLLGCLNLWLESDLRMLPEI